MAESLLELKAVGTQRTGRPRIKWPDDVCNDMKVINMKNGEELALHRKTWNNLVEKIKPHKRF
jgi:hypothetical protein